MEKQNLAAGKRWWMLAAGLAAIAAINAAAAHVVAQRVSDRIIGREAQISQEFINHLFQTQHPGAALFAPPQPSPALLAFVQEFDGLPDVIRANVYSPDRFIRYSSQQGLIGVKFDEVNDDLKQAFDGELVASLETMTVELKAEHAALPLKPGDSFLEIYFPVSGENGKPAAVVELYKRPGGAEALIAELKSLVWTAAGVSGALLALAFCGCFWWGGTRSREPGR